MCVSVYLELLSHFLPFRIHLTNISPILIKMADFKDLAWATSFVTRASSKFIYLPYRASGKKSYCHTLQIQCLYTQSASAYKHSQCLHTQSVPVYTHSQRLHTHTVSTCIHTVSACIHTVSTCIQTQVSACIQTQSVPAYKHSQCLHTNTSPRQAHELSKCHCKQSMFLCSWQHKFNYRLCCLSLWAELSAPKKEVNSEMRKARESLPGPRCSETCKGVSPKSVMQ